MNKLLKIAILIDSTKQIPAWEQLMINNILSDNVADIIALIINDYKPEQKKSVGLTLFQKFENKWFNSICDAFEQIEIPRELNHIPEIEISDNKKISSLNLDIIYCSCLVNFNEFLALFVKYGLWYISFGTDRYTNASPLAFWEVMEDYPEIGSTLNIKLANEPNEIVVYKGTTTAVPFSVKNSLNVIGWKSSSFMLYRLKEFSAIGSEIFFLKYKTKNNSSKDLTLSKTYKTPSNLNMLFLFVRNIYRYIKNKISLSLFQKKFTLLLSPHSLSNLKIDVSGFKAFPLSKNIFLADPFLIEKDEKVYMFYEEFLYSKSKAHITVTELDKFGNSINTTIALDRPYHLSYPFLFEHENSFYMIPETGVNKTVELYKCIKFPDQWEFVKYLMNDIVFIDATLLFHNNKWWLFGNGHNHPSTSTNDQLLLYYSDSPFSTDWQQHPQSPVATQISNCRPAGNIFKLDGKLYRPAQNNSSKQYGYGIKINEIEVLNETEYKEREVAEIRPDKKNKLAAIHTINFTDNLIVIDGIRK